VPNDDQPLFERMAAGEESALAALYDRWATRVHTVATWILQDADEAEDVVEETFWQAWRSAVTFDSRRAAGSTWLMMIARSRAIDRLRRRSATTAWLASGTTREGLLQQAGGAGTEMPDARTDRVARAEWLARALAALPSDQRQVIDLAFFDGLTHAEIAERTSLPLGTVKTRIRLAMQKLRHGLGSSSEEGP
jgi:RNA polymerase sigma-70 factor (ECF subfamily)